mmetsp:Transcript_108813/g.162766  ORF Transcript_108813/g.162766 Transcript_108813/m.162766 type:complete len:612 (-) Transcript_108813:67-1902(-)
MMMEPLHPQHPEQLNHHLEQDTTHMMEPQCIDDSTDEHDRDDEPVIEPLYDKSSSAAPGLWNLAEERKTPFSRMATNWAIHEIRTLCDDRTVHNKSSSSFCKDGDKLVEVMDPSEVSVQGTLGQGGFSSVLKISYQNRTLALKRLRPNHHRIRCENDLVKSATDLTQEISILSNLDHPHIIKLVGVMSGTVSESYRDGAPGYFFCMPLLKETLDQRLERWRNAEKEHSGRRRFLLFGSRKKQRRPSGAPTATTPSSSPSRQRESRRPSHASVASNGSAASTPTRRASLSSLTGVITRRPSLSSPGLGSKSSHSTCGSAAPQRNATFPAPSPTTTTASAAAAPTPSSPPPSLVVRLKRVALPIARGMRYLHDQKFLWRDLKPANIGFDEVTDELKMFDFGLSRHADDQSLRGHGCDVAGTYAYMAPESVLGIKTTYESDVYSFGVLLWELVTLKKPFPKAMRINKAKFKEKVVVGGWRPSLQGVESRALRRLIDVCWDVRPRNRPSFHRIWFLLIRIIAELEQQGGVESGSTSTNTASELNTQSCHHSTTGSTGKKSTHSLPSTFKLSSLSSSFKVPKRNKTPPRPMNKHPPRQLSDCTAETEPCVASVAES